MKNQVKIKGTSKITGIIALVVITGFVLSLTGCDNPGGGIGGYGSNATSGTITINFSSARAIMPWPTENNEILNKIDYEIRLTGPGSSQTLYAKGSDSIRTSVDSGKWQIKVDAFLQGEITPLTPAGERLHYATGTSSADVKPGQTSIVSVSMEALFCRGCDYRNPTPATCEEPGTATVVCSINPGHNKETVIAPPLEHSFGDWEITNAPDCTTTGLRTRICGRCNETDTETVPETGCDWEYDDTATPPTCTTAGSGARTCRVCGESEDTDAIPPTGHTPGAAATCTTAQICTVCSAVIVPATGHTPGAAATCTTAQTCTVCSAVIVPATGHTPGAAATCTTAQTCTICSAVIVPTTGHTWGNWTQTTAPTCLAAGIMTRNCTVCSTQDTTTQTGDTALGHDYTWTLTTQPYHNDLTNVCSTGTETGTCSRCTDTSTRSANLSCLGTQGLVINAGVVGDNSTLAVARVCIPDTATSIANSAFLTNQNTQSVRIGAGVTEIGQAAFMQTSLESITIPATVTSVGGQAFQGCTSLTSITLSEGFNAMGNNMFTGCNNLTSVTIPASVTTISNAAFTNCTSLTSITLPAGVTEIGVGAFSNTGLTNITIPATVTAIRTSAFNNCQSLTSIIIPAGVTEIAYNAFNGCTNLNTVTFEGNNTTLSDGSFENGASLMSVYPAGGAGTYVRNGTIWSKQP